MSPPGDGAKAWLAIFWAWRRDWEREWAWRRDWEKRCVMPWWRKIGRNGVITEKFGRKGVIGKRIGRNGVICRNYGVMAWLRNWRDGVIDQKLRREGVISRKFRCEGVIGTPFGGTSIVTCFLREDSKIHRVTWPQCFLVLEFFFYLIFIHYTVPKVFKFRSFFISFSIGGEELWGCTFILKPVKLVGLFVSSRL